MTARRFAAICAAMFASIWTAQGGMLFEPVVIGKDYDIECQGVKCGSMNFSQYNLSINSDVAGNITGESQTIKGLFTPVNNHLYHWVQVITRDDAPIPWRGDGVTLPAVPYVDTPPGGYIGKNNAFDKILYYYEPDDNPKFPGFFDGPTTSAKQINAAGGAASTFFETWLVCVIAPNPDPKNPANGKDINYTIAPLFGFTWGYTARIDQKDPKSGSILAQTLTTIAAPTAGWKNGLNQIYGAGKNTDRYNVTLVDCRDCVDAVPEPASQGTVALALAVVALTLVRRRFATA